jgi:hypothetical protein
MCSVLEVERKNARSGGKTDSSDQIAGGEEGKRLLVQAIFGDAEILPRSLRSVAGAPHCGAEEKAGHSGRDGSFGRFAARKRKMFVIGLRA